MMSPKLKNFITTTFLYFIGILAYAQKSPPPPNSSRMNDPGPPVGLPMPLDENILLLLGLGLFLGIYYYIIKSKKVSQ